MATCMMSRCGYNAAAAARFCRAISLSTVEGKRILVATTIEGIYDSIKSTLESKTDRFEIASVDVDDVSALTIAAESAQILVTDPAVLAQIETSCKSLQWAQSTYAGVNPLFASAEQRALDRSYVVTRCGGILGPLMATYVSGWITAFERNMINHSRDSPVLPNKDWDHLRTLFNYRPMEEVSVGVLGTGDIGLTVARGAKAMGARTLGLTRRVRTVTSDGVDEFTDLENLLAQSDYVVNVLPSTTETVGLLSGETFRLAGEKSPVFINVGRGCVIDEESILHALDEGWLSAAVLDVFAQEPLPHDSGLWAHPRVHITPHMAALSFPHDVTNVFMSNLQRFVDGDDMQYVVDWQSGY